MFIDKLFRYFRILIGGALFGSVIDGAIYGSQAEVHGAVAGLFVSFVVTLEELGKLIKNN